jgi:hypothetical protein
MKIQDLLNSYDNLVKAAFIPNPQVQDSENQLEQAYGQLSQLLSSAPPEMQQQLGPMLQQMQQLPPDQQLQQITSIVQELSQQGGMPPQDAQSGAPAEAPATPQDATQAEPEGHLNAENNLDNTKVTLSVRELLDLSSGGKATQSLLKVKQMAEAHNKKMELSQQQAEQDQQAAQSEQQAAAQGNGMAQGGIYGQPMNAAAGSAAPQ